MPMVKVASVQRAADRNGWTRKTVCLVPRVLPALGCGAFGEVVFTSSLSHQAMVTSGRLQEVKRFQVLPWMLRIGA